MDVDEFFLICFGFLFFAVYLCVHENRRSESRKDHRNDIEYNRVLNERREFGYNKVEESTHSRPRRFRSK